MSHGLDSPVLVLNSNYQPVRITNARRALMTVYGGAGYALDRAYEKYDFQSWVQRVQPGDGVEAIGTTSGPVCIPRVVVLAHYRRIPRATLRLSRRNIFVRDAYTCQYCGETKHAAQLNLDHVTPRSRGGPSTWENLVTSCRSCNLHKGSATPEEAGMRLLRAPRRPLWTAAMHLALSRRWFEEWEPFLAAVPGMLVRLSRRSAEPMIEA